MTDPATAWPFLLAEVEGLGPFDLVALSPAGKPLHVVEVTRGAEGALEVRVPGRPPIVEELPMPVRSTLRERGFASEDPADPTRPWVHPVTDAEAAVALAQKVLAEVFGEKPDVSLDVIHGSHRAEHEAREKLAIVRERIQKIVTEQFGAAPEQDSDGDYVLPVGDVHVMVAPRAPLGGPVVVRIFAVTTVDVTVSPELGLFLARLNFGLMFGRFALDAEHRAIWFDETLLGDHFHDEELRFAIGVVASTADQWDDRLKQMFGGSTYQEVLTNRSGQKQPLPTLKPGQGGYL
jgi:hypothetical protein